MDFVIFIQCLVTLSKHFTGCSLGQDKHIVHGSKVYILLSVCVFKIFCVEFHKSGGQMKIFIDNTQFIENVIVS